MENEIITGQQSSWSIIKKLGEGDAGEVYLVESLVGGRIGVLKRPQKSAFTGDVLRQATQIKNEGQILQSLVGVNIAANGYKVQVPELLDLSKTGTEYSDRVFIIVEKAPGLDLNALGRIGRMGIPDRETTPEDEFQNLSLSESILINAISENGHIPDRILLTCLVSLLETLHFIHLKPFELGETAMEGYIYNDVKPEHIFLDADSLTITLIDWGNAQFVTKGGMSRNRQYSTQDDYRQFVDGMGLFLGSAAPDLRQRLEWPGVASDFIPTTDEAGDELFKPGGLSERMEAALKDETNKLLAARQREEKSFQPSSYSKDALLQLQQVHTEILSLGAIPDYDGALRFAEGYATYLVMDGDLGTTQEVCNWASKLPCEQNDKWRLIGRLSQISTRSQGDLRQAFLDALQAAICSQHDVVLWNLVLALQELPEPNWWQEVTGKLRFLQAGIDPEGISLLVAVNRLALGLQAVVRQVEDQRFFQQPLRAGTGPRYNNLASDVENSDLPRLQRIYNSLQEDILANWLLVDPPPPHAFLDYDDLDLLLQELAPDLPIESQAVESILAGVRSQVGFVLDAWQRKDFVAASRALRNVLVWDPDRKRILKVDQLILSTPDWLLKVHLGPQNEDDFSNGASWQEFATNLEFEGRELRNHVGPATWLDEILDSLARLRKGIWPADLLNILPGIAYELPWLKRFERLELLPPEILTNDEIVPDDSADFPDFSGACQGVFGPEGELRLIEPLDGWLPEARGSSARVYLGEITNSDGRINQMAVKLMRMDKIEYALPLFQEEVEVLALMDKVPGVNRMLECGFIHLNQAGPLPVDGNLQAVRNLDGDLLRIGPDSIHKFISQLELRVEEGWTPYLGIEIRQKEDNLLFLCDAGMTNGRFKPLVNLLQMAIQICDILETAHRLNIVYRDHKILHYYWQEKTNGVYIIDWNVARLHRDGLSEFEKKMDMVQFGARGLHHILTGRSAPGALPLGPTRPDEIEHAAETYNTQWTYDDQRLSPHLRGIIEAVLAGNYNSAATLRDDLKGTFITL